MTLAGMLGLVNRQHVIVIYSVYFCVSVIGLVGK